MYCAKCGTRLPDDANFCLKCGQQQEDGAVHSPTTTKVIEIRDSGVFEKGFFGKKHKKVFVAGQTRLGTLWTVACPN